MIGIVSYSTIVERRISLIVVSKRLDGPWIFKILYSKIRRIANVKFHRSVCEERANPNSYMQ